MSTAIAVRAAATAVLAGVLTLVTLAVLPPVLAWMSAVVLAVCLVHHLAPARPNPARSPTVHPSGLSPCWCVTHRVNDAHIDQVLVADAGSVPGVVRATRAGTGCGGCLPMLRELCKQMSASCGLHDDEPFTG